jgi:anti-anti-sigma factor
MLPYSIEINQSVGLVVLKGDLTAPLVAGLQAVLKEAIEQGVKELVFDLAKAGMVDSSGIGLLIAASNSLGQIGAKLRVINLSPDILELFCSMRLNGRLNATGRTAPEATHG